MPEHGEDPGKLFAVGSRLGAFGLAMTGSAIGAFFGQDNPQLGVAVATTAAGLLGNLSADSASRHGAPFPAGISTRKRPAPGDAAVAS